MGEIAALTPAASAGDPAPAERLEGLDLARAFAILGMVVVHFSLVMAADRSGSGWLETLLGFLDGRAAATFVVLAGIGVTLMSRRAVKGGDPQAIAAARRTLVRRGVFLLVLGFVNLLIWPGDILRVHGVSMLLAAWLITARRRTLLLLALGFGLGFVALVLIVDFEQSWDWQHLTYRGLWTPLGLVRNLFYDGFRSVFPWTGLVVFGMWLGRLDLRDRAVNRRVLGVALITAAAAEISSWLCVSRFTERSSPADAETIKALFGTESMPALPLFLLAGGGTVVVVIAVSVRLAERWPRGFKPLIATGRMALTWYVAHIVLGLGTVVAMGRVSSEPLPVAVGWGVGFFAIAVAASWLWKLRFRHGPLEWVMRRVAG